MEDMQIVTKKIHEINPAEYNPRVDLQPGDDEYEKIKRSVAEFGLVEPIVWNQRSNNIVGGHQRYKVMKDLGYEEIPVSVVDLDDQEEKALNIALNKIEGDWDNARLKDLLEELDTGAFDMELTGFDFEELEDLMTQFHVEDNEAEEDDFDVEEAIPEEPITKRGDIWQLGKHRLMCGDSTKGSDVAKLMNGKKAEMIFTDPPYLMNFTGSVHSDGSKSQNSSFGEIKNDSMSRGEGDEFILDIVRMINEYVEGAYYICFYRLGIDYVLRALDKIGNKYRALIIWDKGNHTLSNSDYMSKYEPIIYGWINSHNFYGPKGEYDIWEIKRTKYNDLHPTMKPLKLVERAIKNSSKKGDIVLDLFGGSGSTLIASEQKDRVCYMMELDERYCDVIIKRWEEFTGEKAVKMNEE